MDSDKKDPVSGIRLREQVSSDNNSVNPFVESNVKIVYCCCHGIH